MSRTLSDKGAQLMSYVPPYYWNDPAAQAVLDSTGKEIALLEDSTLSFLDLCFPQNADDTYNTLSIWEEILGLPVRPTIPSPYRDIVMADGALAYWRLGDRSTTVATNLVDPTNTGSYAGGFALNEAGAITTDDDTSADFNGTTGRVAGMTTPLTATNNFTLECWARPSSLSQDGIIVFNGDIPDVTLDGGGALTGWRRGGIGLGINNGTGSGVGAKLVAWLREENESGASGTPGTVTRDTFIDSGFTFTSTVLWKYIVLKCEAGVLKFFVDGVQTSGTSSTAVPVPSVGVTIAAHDDSSITSTTGAVTPAYGRFFTGTIDEVAFYGSALSNTRINDHLTAALSFSGPAEFVPDETRRHKVLARIAARRSGYGRDWVRLVTLALGTGSWTYSEGPGAYQLTVTIPFAPGSYTATQAVAIIEDVTPANLQLFVNYAAGFIVGVSKLSIDRL